MKLTRPAAEVHVPDGRPPAEALARTTHLAIGAHPDDLEIVMCDGILQCFQRPDRWFTGVVVTDGAGSARDGVYKDHSDAKMREVRRREQQKAALVGDYAAVVLLDHPSAAAKDRADPAPTADIAVVVRAARPEVVYTHNLADKHDTHVAVALRTIAALRTLPRGERPGRLYGCEAWRDLDWTMDEDKVVFDLTAHESLQAALLGVFDSQIAGGKRYDLAAQGRRRAHATFLASHATDTATGAGYALDLTPLVADDTLDPWEYVAPFIDRFAADVRERLARLG